MHLFQRIWQENRRFILQVGGGLAAFLILKSCIVDGLIGESARSIGIANVGMESAIQQDRARVIAQYPDEMKGLEELAGIEKDLSTRYLTARAANVPDPKLAAPQIQFNTRVGQIWGEISAKARERNVRIPEKITTNELGVSSGDSPIDLERSASYLEILGRALKACVELGMVAVDKPTIILPEEPVEVVGSESTLMVYRKVGLVASGPYDAFKRVLREFQNPGFVQVRIINLDAKGAMGPNALKGQLEFVGIFVEGETAAVEAVEAVEAAKAAPKVPAKPAARKSAVRQGTRRKSP
jgi:hypothetical protein